MHSWRTPWWVAQRCCSSESSHHGGSSLGCASGNQGIFSLWQRCCQYADSRTSCQRADKLPESPTPRYLADGTTFSGWLWIKYVNFTGLQRSVMWRTFLWMELHEPFPFPVLQCIKVMLELGGIIVVIYDTVYNVVISKHTNTGVLRDATWKVIDVGQ